jgi:hypothetical protein
MWQGDLGEGLAGVVAAGPDVGLAVVSDDVALDDRFLTSSRGEIRPWHSWRPPPSQVSLQPGPSFVVGPSRWRSTGAPVW